MGPSFGILGLAALETLRISVPAVMQSARGTLTMQDCDEKLASWSERLLKRVKARVDVVGLEHLDAHSCPYVVVSNHQSLYDIPILFHALPLSLRMAAKKELFQTPVWGKAMTAAGFVEIDRKNGKKAYTALKSAAERMRQDGTSLHIAPEGTRSKSGELGEFKRGAFEIARIMGFPIVPVAIDGAIGIHRSGEWVVHRGCDVKVHVLPLVHPRDFRDTQKLRDTVRGSIAQALQQS